MSTSGFTPLKIMAKTIKALGGLEAILAELADDGLRPGEFTAIQAHAEHVAAGGKRSVKAIRCILQEKANAGKLNTRKVSIDGSSQNAYSAP